MYNLIVQNIYIYVSLQLHVWFLLLATTKWAAKFRNLQTRIIYQPIIKLVFIMLSCSIELLLCLMYVYRKLSIQRESIGYVVRRYFFVSEFAVLKRPNPKSYQLFPFFMEELQTKFGVDGTYRFFIFVYYTMYFMVQSVKWII